MIKKARVVIIVVVVISVLYGLYSLARGLVGISYSSAEVVATVEGESAIPAGVGSGSVGEGSLVEGSSSTDVGEFSEAEGRVYLDDGSGGSLQKVSRLFDTMGLSERQESFLGEDFSYFSKYLEYIESNYTSIFSGIKFVRPEEYEIDVECISGSQDFSVNYLGMGLNFYIGTSLCVIGMYDDSCVVYANNYPELETTELIVVDYSEALFNTDASRLLDFGDYCSLVILDGSYVVDSTFEEMPLVFVEG